MAEILSEKQTAVEFSKTRKNIQAIYCEHNILKSLNKKSDHCAFLIEICFWTFQTYRIKMAIGTNNWDVEIYRKKLVLCFFFTCDCDNYLESRQICTPNSLLLNATLILCVHRLAHGLSRLTRLAKSNKNFSK